MTELPKGFWIVFAITVTFAVTYFAAVGYVAFHVLQKVW